MVICPCSGGTLGRIAHGASTNLVERAADVCLKERRKLVLVPRETPLSLIHIENMLRLTQAGAVILPASPGFYAQNDTVERLVDFVVSRVLDQLGVENTLMERYGEVAPPISYE
jgi:4-hydroxy-3-polyprenylbenzoate decarboxylase